jgi:diacylglycerol kinase (ATP)
MRKSFPKAGYHPIRKLRVILAGLHVAVLSDFSVAYKVIISVVIFALTLRFREWVEVTLILLSTGLMLIAELFNSAIEALCDFVEDQENEKIRIVKDIAAAAAGISILVWATIMVAESNHLWRLLRV